MIVYPGGRYHFERKTQSFGSSTVQTSIFEDAIPLVEVSRANEILDQPEMVNRRDQTPPSGYLMEADFISLIVQRNGSTQKTKFWRYYSPMRVGAAGMPITENNGMKLFQPLEHWIKSNVLERKSPPLKKALPTDCAPQGTEPAAVP